MTIQTIDVAEAQQRLAELLTQVAAGSEFILTEGQTPLARLVPLQSRLVQRTPGLHQGSMRATADFDAPLPDAFWTETQ